MKFEVGENSVWARDRGKVVTHLHYFGQNFGMGLLWKHLLVFGGRNSFFFHIKIGYKILEANFQNGFGWLKKTEKILTPAQIFHANQKKKKMLSVWIVKDISTKV